MNTHNTPLQARLHETQEAFDSVAADYDGPRGNNTAIQEMRAEMWRWLDRSFTSGSRLIDLGCGTGLDAVHLAAQGHRVTATDWSERMVARTRDRAAAAGLEVDARAIGAHELQRLEGNRLFDGAYSNLGPLNCVPDLSTVAAECARLIRPGGRLVFTVIGRWCPWEIAYYAGQRRWARIGVRFSRDTVAVGMNGRTIWTRYYTPAEFHAAFAKHFELEVQRGLCVFVPPPYVTWLAERHPRLHRWLWALDRRVAGWPGFNKLGDHFLLVMRRRAS